MIDLLFVIMLHHEMPINKRQIALTERFFGYAQLKHDGSQKYEKLYINFLWPLSVFMILPEDHVTFAR